MLSNDLILQFGELAAAIWIIVEALRKIPGLNTLTQNIPGETVALFVSVVAITVLVASGQLPADITTVIKVLAAGITAQVAHDKVSAVNTKS